MSELVSVIIPVYNGSKFIKRCLDSVLSQSYTNIEIIAINDGSTDDSLDILNDVASKDTRVSVLSKDNGGVSSARNIAFDKVEGSLITFVDIDDYLCIDHISNLVNSISKSDIGVVGYSKTDDTSNEAIVMDSSMLLDKNQLYEEVMCGNNIGSYLWNKIFRADVVKTNKILFDENLSISEDLVWICKYLMFCNKGYYLNEATYHYCRNENSAFRQMYYENKFDMRKVSAITATIMIKELLSDSSSDIKSSVNFRWVKSRLWILMNMVFCSYKDTELFKEIHNISRQQMKDYKAKNRSSKAESLCATIMYISPGLMYALGRIIGKKNRNKFKEKVLA